MRVDVAEKIESSELGPLHYTIIAIGFLVLMVDGFDLVSMGMVVPILSEEWQIPPEAFSLALSMALIGVLFGSGTAGWLGDKVGRRAAIIMMLAVAGIGMMITPLAQDTTHLSIIRFITGAGAGGCIPVMLAYTQEHMPIKNRNLFTVLMYTGAGMGSVFGGFIGPTLIEIGGWQLIFYTGGIAAFVLIVVVLLLLSESIRFMVSNGGNIQKISQQLARLNRAFQPSADDQFYLQEVKQEKDNVIGELFRDRMLVITLMVWAAFVANQFLVFYVGSWMPTLLINDGLTLEKALYIMAIFNAGGVIGGTAFGLMGDRIAPMRVLLITYSLAAVFLLGMGMTPGQPLQLIFFAAFAGAAVIGSSFLLGAVTTGLYPTHARSTGIGWALAVGRFGAITAPLLGGVFLAKGFDTFSMMAVAMVPAIICAISVFTIGRLIEKKA